MPFQFIVILRWYPEMIKLRQNRAIRCANEYS